jgi:ArsR family metal-binding transcriptional regulator
MPYEVLSPGPAYRWVGTPAMICDPAGLSAVLSERDILCAGWTAYRPNVTTFPTENAAEFGDDVFGRAAIMFFGPCMADETRVRLTAHVSADLSVVLPYVNASMPLASFNAGPCTLTFMDGTRMVTIYPRRIAIGKAEDLVDAWRTLEAIRVRVNQTWARRSSIVPCYELRSRPPALEIYKRLPRTNCGACGEKTCMAFAVSVWQGETSPEKCVPVFSGNKSNLREALLEICRGLGVHDGRSGI